MAAHLDARDRQQHQNLIQRAQTARTTAAKLTNRAAGLRAEAALRATLTPEQTATEINSPAQLAKRTAKTRKATPARPGQQRRYEPPTPERRGPRLGR